MDKKTRLKNWIAPNNDLLPEFIIGGAMKSGTSTLHEILRTHPRIFIPDREIGFFDIDNLLIHPDFNFYIKDQDKWVYQDLNEDKEKIWNWYLSMFKGKENYIKGEDSTSYLASKIAAERISLQKKPIKLIFLLRQPTQRTYSNYFHLLRSGRATYSFEDTIRFNPFNIVQRSLYKELLEEFYRLIPRERIKIILFEDLIKDIEGTVKEVSEFIGIDFNEFPIHIFNTHANITKIPRNINLFIRKNRVFRDYANARYSKLLPNIPDGRSPLDSIFIKLLHKSHSVMNPLVNKKAERMSDSTKDLLDKYFLKELEGIDELVQKDILSKWF